MSIWYGTFDLSSLLNRKTTQQKQTVLPQDVCRIPTRIYVVFIVLNSCFFCKIDRDVSTLAPTESSNSRQALFLLVGALAFSLRRDTQAPRAASMCFFRTFFLALRNTSTLPGFQRQKTGDVALLLRTLREGSRIPKPLPAENSASLCCRRLRVDLGCTMCNGSHLLNQVGSVQTMVLSQVSDFLRRFPNHSHLVVRI